MKRYDFIELLVVVVQDHIYISSYSQIHSVIISPAHSREGYINYSNLEPPLTTNDLLEGTTCQLHGCINADRTRYWEIPGENCTIPFTG